MVKTPPIVQKLRAIGPALLGLVLGACATPRSELPIVDTARVAERRIEVQRDAVTAALAREARVLRLAWPILTQNTALCRKTAPKLGVRIGDLGSVRSLADGLTRTQVEALGYDNTPKVLSVAPGGPAERGGLRAGDIVLAAGDERAEDLSQLMKRIGEELDAIEAGNAESLALTIERAGREERLDLFPVEACDVRVVSSGRGLINAQARFETIIIYAGLVRAVDDDDALAFVIAHELAHVVGRHPRKVIRNAGLTGSLLWGPPLFLSAQLLDQLTWWPAKRLGAEAPPFSTAVQRMVGSAVRSRSFESEADYLGLYMLARAGRDIQAADDVFRLFAEVSPLSSWLEVTHPSLPQRDTLLELTKREIVRKRAAGVPLVPEGWAGTQSAPR